MKIIITEKQYKDIFLSDKFYNLVTEQLIVVDKLLTGAITKGIEKKVIDDLEVINAFKLKPATAGEKITFKTLKNELEVMRSVGQKLDSAQVKALFKLGIPTITEKLESSLIKNSDFGLLLISYKSSKVANNTKKMSESRAKLEKYLPEEKIDEMVNKVTPEQAGQYVRKAKQDAILLEVAGKTPEEKIKYYEEHQDDIFAVFKEDEIDRFWNVVNNPTWTKFKDLVKKYNSQIYGKSEKSFAQFLTDNNYPMKDGMWLEFKRLSVEKQNKLGNLWGDISNHIGKNRKFYVWTIILIAFFGSAAWKLKEYLDAQADYFREQAYDIEKEVSNFLSQEKVWVDGVNIAAINDNIITTKVTEINNLLVKVEPPLKVTTDGPEYDHFTYKEGILKPFIKTKVVTPTSTFDNSLEGFKKWYTTPENEGGYGGKFESDETPSGEKDSFIISTDGEPFLKFNFKDGKFK